jgi:hypothetical protein
MHPFYSPNKLKEWEEGAVLVSAVAVVVLEVAVEVPYLRECCNSELHSIHDPYK